MISDDGQESRHIGVIIREFADDGDYDPPIYQNIK